MNIRIKNILILLLSVTITYSCNNSESNNYMSVSGKIDGLRKGKLYLQQFVDSVFISIDSTEINTSLNGITNNPLVLSKTSYAA